MEYNVVTAELENAGSSLAHDKLGVGTTGRFGSSFVSWQCEPFNLNLWYLLNMPSVDGEENGEEEVERSPNEDENMSEDEEEESSLSSDESSSESSS